MGGGGSGSICSCSHASTHTSDNGQVGVVWGKDILFLLSKTKNKEYLAIRLCFCYLFFIFLFFSPARICLDVEKLDRFVALSVILFLEL